MDKEFIENILKNATNAIGEMKTNSNEWWKSFSFPETPNFSVDNLMNCARSALFGKALGGGSTVFEAKFKSDIDN